MQQALADTTLVSIDCLAVGDWFLTQRDSTCAVGLLFAKVQAAVDWVEISTKGARCYMLNTSGGRCQVLRLSIPEEGLQLQFDLSRSENTQIPNSGQLVICPDLGACVVVEQVDKNTSQQCVKLLPLKPGQLETLKDPKFIFERWSLGYYGADGQWIDIVRREPPLPA